MTTIFGKYKLGDIIGSGSFGDVYMGKSIRTGSNVAIKVDEKYGDKTTLSHEAKILNYLRGPGFIPVLRYYGSVVETKTSYLVINLLGSSLETVKSERKTITNKDAIEVGIQCISMLKYIHQKSIIHRDIKPDNFLFGLDNRSKLLSIIDFGLAKKYVDSNCKHIPEKKGKPVVGTMRYISVNVQRGIEASRRDDIISLAYMLIYIQVDKLPWQGIKKQMKKKEQDIYRIKKETPLSELCKGLDRCFYDLLFYADSLKFDEEPNYGQIEKQFVDALNN